VSISRPEQFAGPLRAIKLEPVEFPADSTPQFHEEQGLAEAHQGVQQGARAVPLARCLLNSDCELPALWRLSVRAPANSQPRGSPSVKKQGASAEPHSQQNGSANLLACR
jgi:hypothetical protein